MSCIVLGDSLAVGVGMVETQCVTQAKVGITSLTYERSYTAHIDADTVVISLGANDAGRGTAEHLRQVRARVQAKRVVWLLPNIQRSEQLDAIHLVASEFHDAVLDTAPYTTGGRLHPSFLGYKRIAEIVF